MDIGDASKKSFQNDVPVTACSLSERSSSFSSLASTSAGTPSDESGEINLAKSYRDYPVPTDIDFLEYCVETARGAVGFHRKLYRGGVSEDSRESDAYGEVETSSPIRHLIEPEESNDGEIPFQRKKLVRSASESSHEGTLLFQCLNPVEQYPAHASSYQCRQGYLDRLKSRQDDKYHCPSCKIEDVMQSKGYSSQTTFPTCPAIPYNALLKNAPDVVLYDRKLSSAEDSFLPERFVLNWRMKLVKADIERELNVSSVSKKEGFQQKKRFLPKRKSMGQLPVKEKGGNPTVQEIPKPTTSQVSLDTKGGRVLSTKVSKRDSWMKICQLMRTARLPSDSQEIPDVSEKKENTSFTKWQPTEIKECVREEESKQGETDILEEGFSKFKICKPEVTKTAGPYPAPTKEKEHVDDSFSCSWQDKVKEVSTSKDDASKRLVEKRLSPKKMTVPKIMINEGRRISSDCEQEDEDEAIEAAPCHNENKRKYKSELNIVLRPNDSNETEDRRVIEHSSFNPQMNVDQGNLPPYFSQSSCDDLDGIFQSSGELSQVGQSPFDDADDISISQADDTFSMSTIGRGQSFLSLRTGDDRRFSGSSSSPSRSLQTSPITVIELNVTQESDSSNSQTTSPSVDSHLSSLNDKAKGDTKHEIAATESSEFMAETEVQADDKSLPPIVSFSEYDRLLEMLLGGKSEMFYVAEDKSVQCNILK